MSNAIHEREKQKKKMIEWMNGFELNAYSVLPKKFFKNVLRKEKENILSLFIIIIIVIEILFLNFSDIW